MQQFAAAGFDFVAITDDNNTTHRRDLQNHPATRPLLISGEEVATAHGHAGVWGLDDGEWVDFRAGAGGIADLVSTTRRFGAVFAIKQKLGLPVKYVGVGEGLDDLEPFDADAFVAALFDKG